MSEAGGLQPEGLRIVICSRNHGFARTLRMALYGCGVRSFQIVADPLSAVRSVTGFDAHALVVQVDAPEHDIGISLIRFMRRWERSPDRTFPIVAVSDLRQFGAIQAIVDAGVNEFASFPVAGDMLLKKVMASINARREFIETRGYVGPCRRRKASPLYKGPERRQAVQIADSGVGPESIEVDEVPAAGG